MAARRPSVFLLLWRTAATEETAASLLRSCGHAHRTAWKGLFYEGAGGSRRMEGRQRKDLFYEGAGGSRRTEKLSSQRLFYEGVGGSRRTEKLSKSASLLAAASSFLSYLLRPERNSCRVVLIESGG